jgi:hypothetical protein
MTVEWGEKQAELIMAPFDHAMDWNEGTPRSGKTTAGTMRFARHLIRSRDALHLVTAYSAEQAYRLTSRAFQPTDVLLHRPSRP